MSEASGNRTETASNRKLRRAERTEKQASTPEQRLADLSAMETTAGAVGRLIEHRLTAWVLGIEE